MRERLISGDLRALYLLWLCAADDDYSDPREMIEPPVPHGLSDVSVCCGELLTLYGLDPLLLFAAAENVDAVPSSESAGQSVRMWAESIKVDRALDLLVQLLTTDTASLKASLLAEIRDSQPPVTWPTTYKQRTYADLLTQTDRLISDANAKAAAKANAKAKREAAKAEQARKARMQEMVDDPNRWLRAGEELADARGTDNYEASADILYDLGEAIGGDEGEKIVRQHAAHLALKHPTLTRLKGSLRKRGLLD